MHVKKIVLPLCLLFALNVHAQSCDCAKELTHVKSFMEENYVGFRDKIKQITKPVYDKRFRQLAELAAAKTINTKCLLIIFNYLQGFRDNHVGIDNAFDRNVYDSVFMASGETIELSSLQLDALKKSHSVEGIYYYRSDSSYKVAVIKSPNALRDYVAVTLEAKNSYWKKGMVKFEMKQYPNGDMRGIIYMRNHMPQLDWFDVQDNKIGSNWQREGTTEAASKGESYEPVASRKLSGKTFYIKIGSFNASNAHRIDSMIKANKTLLDSLPNLIIDVRNNGGGADFAYEPLMPYLYTHPIKSIGVDALSTPATIASWQNILTNNDLPEATKQNLQKRIELMKSNPGKLVNIVDDEIDSSYTAHLFPKKILVLVNEYCASTTEQFLLAAKQSSKVIIAGNHTEGVLDYANVRNANFSCMPYQIRYATTRSRRIDIHQGIDNVGIKPNVYMKKGSDWILEAQKILEK